MADLSELKQRMQMIAQARRQTRLVQNFVRKMVKREFGKTLDNLDTLKEYQAALSWGGRNLGPWLLLRWHRKGCLDKEILRAILIEVWVGAELPQDQLGQRRWIAFFRQSGYLTDCNYPKTTAPLQVYRGCTEQMVQRVSWTKRLETARFFLGIATSAMGGRSAPSIPPLSLLMAYSRRPSDSARAKTRSW